MAVFITAEKKKEFEEELKYLKNEGRKNAVKKIQEARAFGDLSENAEYDIAKAEQGKLEARIVELEGVLSDCEVYEKKASYKKVEMGCVVTVEDMDADDDAPGKFRTYEIVGIYESDPNSEPKKISNESPLGKAFLGAEKDEYVDFEHKGNTVTYRIAEIK